VIYINEYYCKKFYYGVTMIKLLQSGDYHLIETYGHTKILNLNGEKSYEWLAEGNIGEILVTSHKTHNVDHTLAAGKFRLYEVQDEKQFSSSPHLELLVGKGLWQGYTLPTGLPNEKKIRNRIIPTNELITRALL